MDKTYNPQDIEQQRYQQWEENGYFQPNSAAASAYCIMLPPPNVTGSLHMGHGFQHTLMDILIRYHRMQGENTLWQAGADHAGIATQMVVERQLLAQNQSRHDLGREQFIDRVWQWKEESGGNISRQMRRMGSSIDWQRERFTMDSTFSSAVTDVFIRLYDEGLIYKGKRLVNWDTRLLTAISDLEVVAEEEQGHLWYIRYPLVNSDQHVIIATTRPETLLGDVAVAVNPNDERYQHLIGAELELPLTGRHIPIIGDDYVDPDFGSGCVKITPAHDFNDYEVGQRHQLSLLNILTPDGHINDHAPEAYRGLERFAAREKIIADLEQAGLLAKTVSHSLKVPRGDRSGTVIEPFLTEQWYMKMDSLAKPAIAAVKQQQIRIVPETWEKTYFQWLENIEDWCISRQLWWGHRIPAWYDATGQVYVGQDEAQVRAKYQLGQDVVLTQDHDVLDTWFSSALWPFATLGWPQQTEDFKTFYPTSVLISGFDIIFFWIARMIMLGLKFTGEIPFNEVYITGLIRDHNGQKMSKTKGNVLDPIDLIDGISLDDLLAKRTHGLMQPQMAKAIEKMTRQQFPNGIAAYGTDALRFTYCILATTGRDIRFDISRLEGYRNFCNKLWNAARYVLMNTEDATTDFSQPPSQLTLADQWILSRLQQTIEQAHGHLTNYRFDLLAQALYEFTWNEYCDWYLELSKPTLLGETTAELKYGTRHTLLRVLEALLRLLHPIMPYITEEIWQRTAPLCGIQGDSIMLQAYPSVNSKQVAPAVEAEIEWLKQVIVAIRNIRGEMNISPSKPLKALFLQTSPEDKQRLTTNQEYLQTLAKLSTISLIEKTDHSDIFCATQFVGEMEIQIPLGDVIDIETEIQRLDKEFSKVQKELQRIEQKLGNAKFMQNAPSDVVEKEKQKQQELNLAAKQLQIQLEKIARINR